MKKCVICKVEKPTSEFNKNKSKKDGLQAHCRICSQARFKVYWEKNKDKQRATVADRKRRIAQDCREYVARYLQSHPCVDCGNSDFRVLEFDHVTGVKKAGVGVLARNAYGVKVIQAEIDKCEVRCRNCHILKTYERLGGTWHDQYLAGFDLEL